MADPSTPSRTRQRGTSPPARVPPTPDPAREPVMVASDLVPVWTELRQLRAQNRFLKAQLDAVQQQVRELEVRLAPRRPAPSDPDWVRALPRLGEPHSRAACEQDTLPPDAPAGAVPEAHGAVTLTTRGHCPVCYKAAAYAYRRAGRAS